MLFLVVFRMREAVDEYGQKIEVVIPIELPLEIEGVDDAGLAFFVLFLLDVWVHHEEADAAEELSVDTELFEVALDAKLVEVGVFVVGLGQDMFLSERYPDAPPEGVVEVEEVLDDSLVFVLVEGGG